MRTKLAALSALAFAAAFAPPAFADPDRDHDDRRRHHDERRRDDDDRRVRWIEGHYEDREVRRVIPAEMRSEWIADRYEDVVIPAVTQDVRIPAVVERVWVPEVRERVYVPAVTERVLVPARFDIRVSRHGIELGDASLPRYETRVVRDARYEERCTPAHFEERVVQPERRETRIIVPQRCERRLVEAGHYATIVVCAERVEVTRERVWVPGCFEVRDER